MTLLHGNVITNSITPYVKSLIQLYFNWLTYFGVRYSGFKSSSLSHCKNRIIKKKKSFKKLVN